MGSETPGQDAPARLRALRPGHAHSDRTDFTSSYTPFRARGSVGDRAPQL